MGKPLISDAQMRALYRTMLHLRDTEELTPQASSEHSGTVPSCFPIAVLAASLLQLRTDDVLITDGEQPAAQKVLTFARGPSFHPDVLPFTLASAERASAAVLAAGHALAQSHYSHPGDAAPVTLALLSSTAPVQEAIRLAGEQVLPLLVVLHDEPGRPRVPLIAVANVEIIQVDAQDAVAVCRVMQESMLRARNRWGSVVLRTVSLPGTPDPIVAFEAHLRRRGISG